MLTTDLKFGEVQTLSSLTAPDMEKVTFTIILDIQRRSGIVGTHRSGRSYGLCHGR